MIQSLTLKAKGNQGSCPPPPCYYARIVLFKIVHSADRWSNLNYSLLRTHILEISGTSKCSETLRSLWVCGFSCSPNLFPEEGEDPRTLIPCFAHWKPQIFRYNWTKTANVRHCIYESRCPCDCNCCVWNCFSKCIRALGWNRQV